MVIKRHFLTQVNGVEEGLEIVSVTSTFSGSFYNWHSDPTSLAAWRLSAADVKNLSIDVKADASRRKEVTIVKKDLKRHQRASEAPAAMIFSVQLADGTKIITSLV
jgi:hypothetical protein